jgi:hypothetical protein
VVVHLVLYRPKPGFDAEAQQRFAAAIVAARQQIAAIHRFTVGRRMADGPSYKLGPFPDFPYMASIEFEDRAGLVTYLQHPLHGALGQAFNETTAAALVYDFEIADAASPEALLP